MVTVFCFYYIKKKKKKKASLGPTLGTEADRAIHFSSVTAFFTLVFT